MDSSTDTASALKNLFLNLSCFVIQVAGLKLFQPSNFVHKNLPEKLDGFYYVCLKFKRNFGLSGTVKAVKDPPNCGKLLFKAFLPYRMPIFEPMLAVIQSITIASDTIDVNLMLSIGII